MLGLFVHNDQEMALRCAECELGTNRNGHGSRFTTVAQRMGCAAHLALGAAQVTVILEARAFSAALETAGLHPPATTEQPARPWGVSTLMVPWISASPTEPVPSTTSTGRAIPSLTTTL